MYKLVNELKCIVVVIGEFLKAQIQTNIPLPLNLLIYLAFSDPVKAKIKFNRLTNFNLKKIQNQFKN